MREIRLRLFVAGRTARSETAIGNLRWMVDECIPDAEVEIVDVLEQPELAEEHDILVTPTLDKVLPMPARRIIGDLSDMDAVLEGLGLTEVRALEQEV